MVAPATGTSARRESDEPLRIALLAARLAVELASRLDRAVIRRRALERFGVERMADAYEAAYRTLLAVPRSLRAVEPREDAA
jgi:hypothetical protein